MRKCSKRVLVADRAPALSGFRGRLVRLIAAVALSPGSAGFQPAKRNHAGKMPALPGKAALSMDTFSSVIRHSTA
jgi:hypothetical protein